MAYDPSGEVLAALEAEEFGVALGDHHVDVGDFHLAVNVGLVGAVWVASPQAAAAAVIAAAVAAAGECQFNDLLALGTRRVFDELVFSMTFLDSLVAACRACLVNTDGLCPS